MSQSASQRLDAMEANMAAILAALNAQNASPAKAEPKAKAPTSRRAQNAKAQAKVAETTAKAKASGTHRVLAQGATSVHESIEIGAEGDVRTIRIKLVNANGHRVQLCNQYGKANASLTMEDLAWLVRNEEEIAAVVDEADERESVGAYKPKTDEADA